MKFKFNTDRLLAILAFLISLCTLYVFFYQTSLMKRQQFASVLPHLNIGNTEELGDYGFIIENNGIGPSFIDEINIHYKDSIYKNADLIDFYSQVIDKKDTILNLYNISHSTIRKGMLIPEKDKRYMIRLDSSVPNFRKKVSRLRHWFNKEIKVEVIYSSVYEEQWKIVYPETEAPIKLK